ncbi:N-acetylmuramoyl-L-alanine amidase [Candidatus Sumerlaeota bacterium]|nr:N-acetylmuramoyl-L-alanine amidase [Candidatus Sumerlaeota bacterium]
MQMPFQWKRYAGYFLSLLIIIVFIYLNFLRPRWKYIIIHHSATEMGSVKIFYNGHKARGGAWPMNDPMLYHIVIGNGDKAGDGELQAGGRWLSQQFGGGCCTVNKKARIKSFPDALRAYSEYFNFTGIHICLVGNFEKGRPSEAQMATLKDTVTFLRRRYRIPPSSVMGHKEAQFAPTDCPGKNFSMSQFRKEILLNPESGAKVKKTKASSLLTWKVRLINFWPVWGILLGEIYYSTFLILIDAGLFYLFARIALPLVWKSRKNKKLIIPVDIPKKDAYQKVTISNPDEDMKS